ncbi:Gfo/Idh/MocA family oxidoreductase [Cytophaga sp. FL35]|uniref:Gfo/Idh/MocA family protein n=1 Tax=Cytophaga sp. FL35 TaxID=1904456 RepID=UPI001653D750|nr:Gfo/Idh/MocA family oxidoreductase [Cytophaga sp. FL35]MBC6998900.1 Gfo/Idh/MocA family oxidoreductase [Cytophaga sp. FL35]
MKSIKVALIGAGYIADYHARAIQKLANVDTLAVVARTLKSAQRFASKYKIPHTFDDIKPLLNNSIIDAVILSTPNALHAPHAIAFLKHGKDVFIEKPLALSEKEAFKIETTASKCQQKVMVGHMWRFDREAQFIKATIERGDLGKIIKTKGYGIHENWGPTGWFTNKKLAGGGALADMGVHAIDTVRFLLNDPKPVKVYARIATNFGDYEVDDSAILVITWSNGTESIIESGWWQPHMDGPEASTAIFGTEGYARLFPTSLKIKNGDSSEISTPIFPKKNEHCDQSIYDKQMAYFIDCIQKNRIPVPGLKEGIIVNKIVDAAYKSSKLGEAVNIIH